jgi:Double-GTPase 2
VRTVVLRWLCRGATALALSGSVLAGSASAAPAPVPATVLTSVSAAHHRGYDQLVFQFTGRLPAHVTARYVSRLPVPASGTPVTMVGGARLLVSFSRSTQKNSPGLRFSGASAASYALPGVIQVAALEDQRNLITFGVGVARREPIRVQTLTRSDQVAIDVRTPYQTVSASAFFVTSLSMLGRGVIQSAARPVIRPVTASNVLQRLFAGPTAAELARGMQFVASGTTGFTRVTVRDGIARVYLAGTCNSGGSAITVADEIMPALQQIPSVQWVKIYDSAGNTEEPSGDLDSIPACLQASTVKLWTARHGGYVLLGLVLTAALGVLVGLVLSLLSVLAGLALRTDLIVPSAYLAERTKAHPVATGQFEPDVAWPSYPLRQVRADLARIWAEQGTRYRKLWNWPFGPVTWILFLPVTLAALLCLAVAGLSALVFTGLFSLVMRVCAAVLAAASGGTVMLLRGVESAWHARMRTEASCPRCYHVTPRPAYHCPKCGRLHRDVRPGRLGLFTRRCVCGQLLPTMVLRAAWRLEAVCQKCGEPLRPGSAALRDVRIPIFGDTSAGKTRLMYAALDSLIEITTRAGIPLGFPDEESQNQATVALDLIRSERNTVKTSEVLPTALTCRVGAGLGATLVHLFDAAGENYHDGQLHDSLGFLDHGHGLVYVLDPFSIGAVRNRMAGRNISLAHAATGDPETAYTEVVTRLRDSGVEAAGQRLAVVVSKADLLSQGGLELPDDSDAIADWLMEVSVHNLVLSARREFAEARFFAVASLAASQTGRSHDPGVPLRWLLVSRGVRLPGGQDGGAARAHQDRAAKAPL